MQAINPSSPEPPSPHLQQLHVLQQLIPKVGLDEGFELRVVDAVLLLGGALSVPGVAALVKRHVARGAVVDAAKAVAGTYGEQYKFSHSILAKDGGGFAHRTRSCAWRGGECRRSRSPEAMSSTEGVWKNHSQLPVQRLWFGQLLYAVEGKEPWVYRYLRYDDSPWAHGPKAIALPKKRNNDATQCRNDQHRAAAHRWAT